MLLTNALVLLSAAIIVAIVFHKLKLPSIVSFITAGLLVGPSGLGLVPSIPEVGYITEAAAVLLMFTIGLEFSANELANYRRPILVLGLGQMLFTILFFTLIFWLGFNYGVEKSLMLSFLIAPSSTAVVLKLLTDQRDLETPYGRGAVSVLLLQDLAVIPMMVAIPFLVKTNELSSSSFFDSLMPLLIFASLVVLLIFIMNRYLLPQLLERVALTKNRELFFFTVLLICIGTGAFMHSVGLSYSLGAFIAGMLLASSPYGKQATVEILPLRDSFLSLFFVAIGMMLDLSFVIQNIHKILLIALIVISIKGFLIYGVLWFSGNMSNISRAVALLLFQFGEFSFILADLGVNHNLLTENERQYFVAVSIISLALTPFLYGKIPWIIKTDYFNDKIPNRTQAWLKEQRTQLLRILLPKVELESMPHTESMKDHVVVVGFGVAGQSLCRVLRQMNVLYQIIELNAETVRIHKDTQPMIYGDAASEEILKKAGIEQARLVAVLTSGVHMLEPILAKIRAINPAVRVVARTNYIADTKRLPSLSNTALIVGEIESSLEIIYECLREFNFAAQPTDEVINRIRAELKAWT